MVRRCGLLRYDGEDVSPTTAREIRGFYFLGLSAEIFAVCGVGSFAPVLLEQLAKENGVLRSDLTTPCIAPNSSVVRRDAVDAGQDQCVVTPFGRPVSTASFAMYTFSLGVFLQALTLISFSPVADYGKYRKSLLLGFAMAGAGATMALAAVGPSVYLLASLLVAIAVVCLGSTFVLLNSYLPLLAANHPSVQGQTDDPVRATPSSKTLDTSAQLRLSTQISSKGIGYGYAAAVSSQVLSILLLVLLKKANFRSESTPLRYVLLMVGILWLSLTLPGTRWLRSRPGPSLSTNAWRSRRLPPVLRYLVFAWSSVFQTIKTAARLRQTLIFLAAWFILSDAIATVSGTAILFARTELHMATIPIALLSITVTTSGIAGALLWPRISRIYHLETKHTIMACMLLMEIIPLYGLLGSIPFIKSFGVGGLQQAWEIYPLGVVHGVVMGGISAYARALYGEMIPPGSEAAFFALYAITDKGSSAVGPAIVGAIVDAVGTIRPAFAFLAVLIALPIPLVWYIDIDKGREDAVALATRYTTLDQGIIMQDRDHEATDSAAEGLLDDTDEEEDHR